MSASEAEYRHDIEFSTTDTLMIIDTSATPSA
jgi:hypothetical protein